MAWKVVMVDQRLLVRARLCVAVSRLDVRWQVLRGVRARALSSRTVFNLMDSRVSKLNNVIKLPFLDHW